MKTKIYQILKIIVMGFLGYCFGYAIGKGIAPAKADDNNLFFKDGQEVTCSYYAVKWYMDNTQFVEVIPMTCKVLKASNVFPELEPNYQHIKVNCTKDIQNKSSPKPGFGMVKDHPLNYKILWLNSNDCIHFVSKA